MGRTAREKWNRRLRQLAAEEADRRRADQHGGEQSDEPVSQFLPVSFWAEWFRKTAESQGPAFALRVLCDGAVGDKAWHPRATDWWPEEVDRADVDELKAILQAVEDLRTGTAAVALVELLAEAIATRGLPAPGDVTADGFSAAVINLTVAIKTEIELALEPTRSIRHRQRGNASGAPAARGGLR